MRLAIVAHNLHAGGGRSIGVNLARALSQVDVGEGSLIIAPQGRDYAMIGLLDGVELMQVDVRRMSKRLRFDLTKLRDAVQAFDPDWVVGLGNVPIRSCRFRQALLVHDANLFAPDARRISRSAPLSLKMKQELLRRRLASVGSEIDLVFCQTAAAANATRKAYPGIANTAIIPNVISDRLQAPATNIPPREAPSTGSPFSLLTVSRYYPHKNLEVVVTAFERYKRMLEDVQWTITIEASHGPGARSLLRRIRDSDLQGSIHNVGPVTQAAASRLYEESDAVIVPSYLESFSANYIEAMHFGKPILASDRDFAREICGGAAQYFDPESPLSVANAIARLKDGPDLAASLATLGRLRLATFPSTWDAVANAMVQKMHDTPPR